MICILTNGKRVWIEKKPETLTDCKGILLSEIRYDNNFVYLFNWKDVVSTY